MTCRELAEFLAEYVGNELKPDVHGAFEQHLSVCRTCRDYLSTYRSTIDAAQAAFDVADRDLPPPPPELVKAILASRQSIRPG